MNGMSLERASVVLRGSAATRGDGANPYAARVKTSVRYADPMAWALVRAIGEATEPLGEGFRSAVDRCALIQVGPEAPPQTMTRVASEALRGFASPIRFPAATPSAPTGLACIVHGLRGPTLTLTVPVAEGAGLALALASAWLSRDCVDFVLIATTASVPDGAPRAACAVLSQGEGSSMDRALLVKTLQAEPRPHD